MDSNKEFKVITDTKIKERLLKLALDKENLSQEEIQCEEYLIAQQLVKVPVNDLETLFIQKLLLNCLAGEDPFPTLKKKSVGRKSKVDSVECAFLLNKTKSINETANLLGVSNKAIRNTFPTEYERDDIKHGNGMWKIFERVYSKEFNVYREKYKNL